MLTWQVHGGAMAIEAVLPSASGSPVGEARPTAAPCGVMGSEILM